MNKENIFHRKNRILLFELVKTDFKLRYQGSFLGILWSIVKPLLLFAVMYTVFVHVLHFTDGTASYPLVLLLGIALWSFFTEATGVGMQSIVSRGDLLRKITFPKYIVVLSSMVSALISLSINLVVVVIFAVFSGVHVTSNLLFLPLNVLQFFALAFGLSLLLATLYVKFRDIGHIYEVLLQMLFYAMPIIYPLSLVADRGYSLFGVGVHQILLLNPIAQTIQDIRHNLIAPETVPTTWNTVQVGWLSLLPVVLSGLIVVVGLVYFGKNSRKFAEEL